MFSALKKWQATILLLLILSSLVNCADTRSVTRPIKNDLNGVVLPERQVKKYINTRVVVSYDLLPIVFQQDINNCFRYTEEFYNFVDFRFVQNSYVSLTDYKKYWTDINLIHDDAAKYPNTLSVYFFPYIEKSEILGISPVTYHEHNANYIIIYVRDLFYRKEFIYTFAHEIGHHFFGLLHPFGEDYCDDTPLLPAYSTDNVMDCGGSLNPTITKDQIERGKLMYKRFIDKYTIK